MDNSKSIKTYRSVTMGAVHTLLALFIFGMIANLYVEIPEELVSQQAWAWVFGNSAIIAIHVVLGTLLLLAAVASLIFSFKTRRTAAVVASVAGLVFTLAAYYFGSDFVSAGGSELSSLLMAFGFLGALVSYGAGVFKSKTN
ncbi:MAG: hypothetical protein VB013_08265 [Anaerolineaceae bacterium]|nr:hypothetical protein [Anaerolineaceae bacterium]